MKKNKHDPLTEFPDERSHRSQQFGFEELLDMRGWYRLLADFVAVRVVHVFVWVFRCAKKLLVGALLILTVAFLGIVIIPAREIFGMK